MTEQTPAWIDEYARAMHRSFSNMVPCSWGPIDAFTLVGNLQGTFITRVSEAVTRVRDKNLPAEQVASAFSCPSTLRVALLWLLVEYQYCAEKPRKVFREIFEYLVGILTYMVPKDTWAFETNVAHSQQTVARWAKELPWESTTLDVARELGRLYNSLESLAHALYRDFFPQDSIEVYGPYDASGISGPGILLLKHFPKIRPVELWPETASWPHTDVKLYQTYKDVKFRCEMIGMHSVYTGDAVRGMQKYCLVVDGAPVRSLAQIREIRTHFETLATQHAQAYEHMSQEEIKEKFLEWECYQFINFFSLAGMDWRPTEPMKEVLQGKVFADRFRADQFPDFEEYATSAQYEVYWLKDVYASS